MAPQAGPERPESLFLVSFVKTIDRGPVAIPMKSLAVFLASSVLASSLTAQAKSNELHSEGRPDVPTATQTVPFSATGAIAAYAERRTAQYVVTITDEKQMAGLFRTLSTSESPREGIVSVGGEEVEGGST